MPRVVIAAGGTAGHVVPALAVADALRDSGAEISFLGARGRLEERLVPAAGFDLDLLRVRGLDRGSPIRAAESAALALAAVPAAARALRRRGADVVMGGGGYVAGPAGLAALGRRTPLVLTEADRHLGLANRLLARRARRVCLAFPIPGLEDDRFLVTGRPVPDSVIQADRDPARRRFGIDPDERCLLVFGGSQGARSINLSALDAFLGDGSAPPRAYHVLHIAGSRDYPAARARLESTAGASRYTLLEYEPSLGDSLAACDLVLARAGGSVFELAAAGKAAILVPYPHAAARHQHANAEWMAEAGAAVTIEDSELTAESLRALVAELFADPGRLAHMARASKSLARPDAARRIAEEILKAASGGPGPPRSAPERPASAAPPKSGWSERTLHFVAIGGAGMSGLALVSHRLGAQVTGSDRAESSYLQRLREHGIEPTVGHDADSVPPDAEVVVSTAVPEDNPELRQARERGQRVIHRGELLAELCSAKRLLTVAGTHGKTTTAGMAVHALRGLGADPAFLIGGELPGAGPGGKASNADWGEGEWIIAEADESDASFLLLEPEIAVITNVELDHHSRWGSRGELFEAFRGFADPAEAVALLADPALDSLAEGKVAVRFSEQGPGPALRLPVPGRHNVLNARAALAGLELAGFDTDAAAAALRDFPGMLRRLELKGHLDGAAIYDDYAHHPTEVAAALEALRELSPRRLVAVFQPHLYSRTRALGRELGRALALADEIAVLDVYPAREQPVGELAGVSGLSVAQAAAESAAGRRVWWLQDRQRAELILPSRLREDDILVTIGAGDIYLLAEALVEGE